MNCLKYPELVKSRSRIVEDYGDKKASIMFIGICPGNHLFRGGADSTGIPFKGDASGRLFERLLTDLGLTRESVYTTNIVKCRPCKDDKKYYNRLPTEKEINNCLIGHLQCEIAEINPDIVICFGHLVYERLKEFYRFNSYNILYAWHPAYIARDNLKYDEWLCDVKKKLEFLR